jgi:hypothetical protein
MIYVWTRALAAIGMSLAPLMMLRPPAFSDSLYRWRRLAHVSVGKPGVCILKQGPAALPPRWHLPGQSPEGKQFGCAVH